jgi:GH25 family lysozyme M1 (1,4-beta-N-acetylmuramidase)
VNNLIGLDVSHWQGEINWATAKMAGCKFVFVKCTQGINFFDDRFNYNWSETEVYGIPRGPYHWYEPELNPITQANWFVQHCPNPGELPYVLDVEDGYNIPGDYAVRLKQCIDRIVALTGTIPMIYTRASYWKVYLGRAMGWADQYPLWSAHYKDNGGPSVCLPWTPGTWSVWQFTSSGPGQKYGMTSLEVDMNVSNGDLPTASTMTKIEKSDLEYRSALVKAEPEKPSRVDWLAEQAWKLRQKPEFNKRMF